jgi:hypothetical protein
MKQMNINRDNYEEYFLLYIDRELSGDEQKALESFVRRNPDLEKELERLKQTVAPPPVIVFENKDILLREEKKRRFLPVYWTRIAAALVILLTGAGVMLMIIPSKKRPLNETADQIKKPAAGESRNQIKGKNGDQIEKASPELIADQTKNKTIEKNSAHTEKARPGMKVDHTAALPDLARQTGIEETTVPNFESSKLNLLPSTNLRIASAGKAVNRQPSTVNHQPSTINHQPSTNPDESTSIFVFDNKSKPVTRFFRKLLARSPDDNAVASNNQKRVSVSIFQFSMSK